MFDSYFMLREEYRCTSETTVKESCFSHCAIFAKQLKSKLPDYMSCQIIGVEWMGVVIHWLLRIDNNGCLFFVDGEGIFTNVETLLKKYDYLEHPVVEVGGDLEDVCYFDVNYNLIEDSGKLHKSIYELAALTEAEDMNFLEGEGNTLVNNWINNLEKYSG